MRTNLINKAIGRGAILQGAILSGVMSLMLLASCSNPGSTSAGTSAATYNQTPISGSGVVVFRDIDGGFYGILSDSGSNQFVPVNLPASLQNDGVHIRFTGTVGVASENAHNWGTAVRIENVDQIR